MSSFDEFFKKKFSDLHEACCCSDLVAMNYKKAMKKTWNEQQKKIDAVNKLINDFFDNQTTQPTAREYCNILADAQELLK